MAETTASGRAAVDLATALLQRIRVADPTAGLWEAADVQWWSRRPRASDAVEQVFWIDESGPVAAVLLTSWPHGWEWVPLLLPGAAGPSLAEVWARAQEQVAAYAEGPVENPIEILVRDDDAGLIELVRAAGLVGTPSGATSWLEIADRPEVSPVPDRFVLVDRTQRADAPHPMVARNGAEIADRLASLSLYDPALDFAVETTDGRPAGYVLMWADPVTRTGLIEPVRVEDEFHRRGLARAMLTAGIERLAERGVDRVKIGWSSEPAAALYQALGFRAVATDTSYRGPL